MGDQHQKDIPVRSCFGRGNLGTSRTPCQYDGQDYPVTGSPDFDSLSAQQADGSTARFILKKGGKPVGTTTRTVSKDGKTLTATMKVATPKGQSESELVFDRQ